jgi:hypothetical protein
VQAYLERYRKKYNRESDLYGPYFYDAVKLYAEAIRRGGLHEGRQSRRA